MAEYLRNHVASVTYLNSWAADGALRVMRPAQHPGRSMPGRPDRVAFRNGFWSKDDGAVRTAAEEACGKLEELFPELLRAVSEDWPLRNKPREALAEFMSLHVIRTPAWKEFHTQARENALRDLEKSWTRSIPFDDAAAALSSDSERVKAFGRHLHLTAALVANMHWTLVRWPDPVLATSDQPASVFPFVETGVLKPYEAFPTGGISQMLELRFPLTPTTLLIASWLDWPDIDAGECGTDSIAINVNESITQQAEHEWFHAPGGYPRLTPAVEIGRRPSTPLSFELLDVDALKISKSRRRRHALREADRIAETDDSSVINIVDFGMPRPPDRYEAA